LKGGRGVGGMKKGAVTEHLFCYCGYKDI